MVLCTEGHKVEFILRFNSMKYVLCQFSLSPLRMLHVYLGLFLDCSTLRRLTHASVLTFTIICLEQYQYIPTEQAEAVRPICEYHEDHVHGHIVWLSFPHPGGAVGDCLVGFPSENETCCR